MMDIAEGPDEATSRGCSAILHEYNELVGRQRSMFLVSEIVEKRNSRDVEAGYRGPDFPTNYS